MAKRSYNTFVVVDCGKRKPILVTSSARKANDALSVGKRVEVWNCNKLVERIYNNEKGMMIPYVSAEKEFIRNKQKTAEKTNKMRRGGTWRMAVTT